MTRLTSLVSSQIVALAAVVWVIPSEAQTPRGSVAVRSETVRAAESGDDERFGMSLAADRVRVVMFLKEPFAWGSAMSDARRAASSTVDDALATYRGHHPYLSFRTEGNGVLVAALPRDHCAAPVLNQRIDEWSFTGSYRDFERAFDRQFHHLEGVVEGGPLGPPPAPESPMLTPITISVRRATGLEILVQALEQLDGAVAIFREYTDKTGQSHCVRETYVRDATVMTLIGYDRNPERFARPRK